VYISRLSLPCQGIFGHFLKPWKIVKKPLRSDTSVNSNSFVVRYIDNDIFIIVIVFGIDFCFFIRRDVENGLSAD